MRSYKGVSLVEMMVVLAIIGILLGLLIPAVQKARESAREAVCKNNVYQINLAAIHYQEVHKKLPARGRNGKIGGWIVDILPFIEQQNLQASISKGADLSSASESLMLPPAIFRCPRSSTLDGTVTGQVSRGHYTMVTHQSRKYLAGVWDSPVNLKVAWLIGPEKDYQEILQDKGPHHDGFFYSSGGQQGVSFMLNGQDVR